MSGSVQRNAGFSYVEVLVATILVVTSLLPALQALQTGVEGSDIHKILSEDHYQLSAKLEEVLAEPYTALEQATIAAGDSTTPSTYSDASGSPARRLVFLSYYDGDNADTDNDPFTGTDSDLIWVAVRIEGNAQVIESLITVD